MTPAATEFGKKMTRRLVVVGLLCVGAPGALLALAPFAADLVDTQGDDWAGIRVVGGAALAIAAGMLAGLVLLSVALLSTSRHLPLKVMWLARVAPFVVAGVVGHATAGLEPMALRWAVVPVVFLASGITAALVLRTREHWLAVRSSIAVG